MYVLSMQQTCCRNPYKTCRLLILLRSFTQKGSQKYQKTVRFFSKTHTGLDEVVNPYKTCGKLVFLCGLGRPKGTFVTQRFLKNFRGFEKFFKGFFKNSSSQKWG